LRDFGEILVLSGELCFRGILLLGTTGEQKKKGITEGKNKSQETDRTGICPTKKKRKHGKEEEQQGSTVERKGNNEEETGRQTTKREEQQINIARSSPLNIDPYICCHCLYGPMHLSTFTYPRMNPWTEVDFESLSGSQTGPR